MHTDDALVERSRQAVTDYLKKCGFRILDHDWQCPEGHLDIVATERERFVVCQIKTQRGTRHGSSLEEMSDTKRRRLRTVARSWLDAHGMRFDQIRIDVVGLLYEGTGGYTIEHVRAVG